MRAGLSLLGTPLGTPPGIYTLVYTPSSLYMGGTHPAMYTSGPLFVRDIGRFVNVVEDPRAGREERGLLSPQNKPLLL